MKNINWSRKKIFLLIISGALLVLSIFGLTVAGNFFAFLLVFPWMVEKIIISGMNPWIAKAIAVVGTILFIFSVNRMFSRNAVKRKIGFCFFGSLFVLYFLGMFIMTQDHNYDSSGKTTKCCSATPYGTDNNVSCEWQVHPIYGTAVRECVKNDFISSAMNEKGIPTMAPIKPIPNMRFFTQDGLPLFWYYQHPNGKIELFNESGRHPQLNVVLSPVNSEIVRQLFDFLDKGKKSMITGLDEEVSQDVQDLKDLRDFILSMEINLE